MKADINMEEAFLCLKIIIIALIVVAVYFIWEVIGMPFRPIKENEVKEGNSSYFSSPSLIPEKNGIYRYNNETKELKQLTQYYGGKHLTIYKGWVYFIKERSSAIYRVSINGEDEKNLTEECYNYDIYNDKIFYDNDKFYMMDLNGENKKALTNFEIRHYRIENDKIIVENWEENNKKYSIDLNTLEIHPYIK